jgi:transcriptional regulator with XRE-family HTH domain
VPRERPVFHKEIGQFFKDLREARGWTLRQAADIAHRNKKAPVLTRQVMFRMERGQVKVPEAAVLKGFSALYGVTYETLAGLFVSKLFGLRSDLLRHDGQDDEASLRGAYETASARVVELEEELRERDARLGEVQDVASRLIVIAAGPKGTAAPARARARRGGHRKTG